MPDAVWGVFPILLVNFQLPSNLHRSDKSVQSGSEKCQTGRGGVVEKSTELREGVVASSFWRIFTCWVILARSDKSAQCG